MKRLDYLRVVIAAAYFCGILMSPGLWFGLNRSIPRIPVIAATPAFIIRWDWVLATLLVAALLAIVFSQRSRYLAAAVLLTLLLVLIDQTRLQPWVYQYSLMLGSLAFLKQGDSASDSQSMLPVLVANQLIIGLLYFWSGTQKFNWTFAHEIFPRIFLKLHLPANLVAHLPKLAVVVAACEALIGMALIVRKSRRVAAILAIAMHSLVLLLFVITRRNSIVWPWNAAMAINVWLLFWKVENSIFRTALFRWREFNFAYHLPKVVILICGIAPVLSFVGWNDLYLSGAIYSGNNAVGFLRVNENARAAAAIPQLRTVNDPNGEPLLPLSTWSMKELSVPPYPQARTFKQLARRLCAHVEDPRDLELVIKQPPAMLDGSHAVTRLNCSELLQ